MNALTSYCVITGRIATKRQTAGNVFTQWAFSPRNGWLVAPIHVKFGTTQRHWVDPEARGSAWPCEISPQSMHGVGTRPQKLKISTYR